MVKAIACIRRKPGMSEEDFHRYWKETHGPLFLSVTEVSRHVRRYIQFHTLHNMSAYFPPQTTPPYDGVVEMWFESMEAMEQAMTAPQYREIIRPDEEKFIDLPNCVTFLVEEVPMKEG